VVIITLGKVKDFKGKSWRDLFNDVINRGLCTACGTCAAVCPLDLISMSGEEPLATEEERKIAEDKCIECGQCYACCPGERVEMDDLERKLFNRTKNYASDLLGIYKERKVSFASDEDIRLSGASGGTAASLQIYALDKGIVDAIVGVGYDDEKPWVPKPVISKTKEEVLSTQGSKYTHCSVNDVIKEAVKDNLRVGVVGLPCHIHGIRKIQELMPNSKLSKNIVFTIGLFCAENRFTRGVEHIITKRLGVPLSKVIKISYREGHYPGSFTVWDDEGNDYKIKYPDQLTFIWMHTRPRCRICYDYSSELADISLGETQHLDKSFAHNAALIRTSIGKEIFDGAVKNNYIVVNEVEEKMIVNHTGLERKKYANAIRIEWYRNHNIPTPNYPEKISYNELMEFYFGPKR